MIDRQALGYTLNFVFHEILSFIVYIIEYDISYIQDYILATTISSKRSIRSIKPHLWWDFDAKPEFPSDLDLFKLHTYVQARSGWVYVMHSPQNPDWGVKIGMTKRDPFIRAHELANAGAMHTFDISAAVWTMNAPHAEKLAHKALKAKHLSKEWFNVSHAEAAVTISDIMDEERAELGRLFDLELLILSDSKDFVERGLFVEELISSYD